MGRLVILKKRSYLEFPLLTVFHEELSLLEGAHSLALQFHSLFKFFQTTLKLFEPVENFGPSFSCEKAMYSV